jgi:hypothetical protein
VHADELWVALRNAFIKQESLEVSIGSIAGVVWRISFMLTEELLDRKGSGSCLENREYGRRDPSR